MNENDLKLIIILAVVCFQYNTATKVQKLIGICKLCIVFLQNSKVCIYNSLSSPLFEWGRWWMAIKWVGPMC